MGQEVGRPGAAGQLDAWIRPIWSGIAGSGAGGGFLVCLPEYRPDLARNLAFGLDLCFVDFRQAFMSALGWEAHTLDLGQVSGMLRERSEARGLVLFNVEALLATKAGDERRDWLEAFLSIPFEQPVLAVLWVFAEEVPHTDDRVFRVDAGRLPPQGLISRLAW